MALLNFYDQANGFSLKNRKILKVNLLQVIGNEGYNVENINFIFLNDNELLEINKQYLNHDDLTDIITFDLSEDELLNGEIYISVDRVKENAVNFKAMFHVELYRVMVHGLLHLMGYTDKEKKKIKQMREREDYYLNHQCFTWNNSIKKKNA